MIKTLLKLTNNHSYMDKIKQNELQSFISGKVISPFYKKRFDKLGELTLNKILKRKNPYLFKAKNIQTAEELVKYTLDAFLSSQEETIFGNLMEGLAVFVCSKVFDGYKAEQGKFKSIDLIFNRNGITYVVGIKSGPYWGNKDQIDKLKNNFRKARAVLQKDGVGHKVIAVNGCIYGKEHNPYKIDRGDRSKNYYKLCGQEFWELISGDVNFYQKIIIPIDKEAKKKDETFKDAYNAKINESTKDFSKNYLNKKSRIDWEKIIDFVSKKD